MSIYDQAKQIHRNFIEDHITNGALSFDKTTKVYPKGEILCEKSEWPNGVVCETLESGLQCVMHSHAGYGWAAPAHHFRFRILAEGEHAPVVSVPFAEAVGKWRLSHTYVHVVLDWGHENQLLRQVGE